MRNGSTLLWLILCGAGLFALGFFSHNLLGPDPEEAPPSYFEKLTVKLHLNEKQQESVQRLLNDADEQVSMEMGSSEGRTILERIGEIRKKTSNKIYNLLDEDQKKLFGEAPPPKEDGEWFK